MIFSNERGSVIDNHQDHGDPDTFISSVDINAMEMIVEYYGISVGEVTLKMLIIKNED